MINKVRFPITLALARAIDIDTAIAWFKVDLPTKALILASENIALIRISPH